MKIGELHEERLVPHTSDNDHEQYNMLHCIMGSHTFKGAEREICVEDPVHTDRTLDFPCSIVINPSIPVLETAQS